MGRGGGGGGRGGGWGLSESTPAGRRAKSAMAKAAAGPGGRASPEFQRAYKDAQAEGEKQRVANARMRTVDDSLYDISRLKGKTDRSARRGLARANANLERIRGDVGANSTKRGPLNSAIRRQYKADTR